jgi:hypothetical protein
MPALEDALTALQSAVDAVKAAAPTDAPDPVRAAVEAALVAEGWEAPAAEAAEEAVTPADAPAA